MATLNKHEDIKRESISLVFKPLLLVQLGFCVPPFPYLLLKSYIYIK